MLWVDDELVTVDDLASIEPELLEIAKTEKLTLEGSNGLLQRAKEACQTTLSNFMAITGVNTSDLSLRNVNTPAFLNDRTTQYAGFAQVVVSGETETNWSPIKQWIADRTLRTIYQAAVNRNTDRYQQRFDSVDDRIKNESWPRLRRVGLPLVYAPLPAPGAIMERAGSFGSANVTLVANVAGTSTDEIDVVITWVSDPAATNFESYRSQRFPITLVNGQVLKVTLAGLIPPDGKQPAHTQASSRYSTRVATGWNVYVGKRSGTLYLQNLSPLGLAVDYTATTNPTYSGTQSGLGQYADINLVLESNLRRC
jgi:hypothetical protein